MAGPTSDGDLRVFRNEESGCGQIDATITAGNESVLACELHNASFLTRLASNMMNIMHMIS